MIETDNNFSKMRNVRLPCGWATQFTKIQPQIEWFLYALFGWLLHKAYWMQDPTTMTLALDMNNLPALGPNGMPSSEQK